ncbi:MAG: amino acid adenylation domain-containing protein, partial [Candidatus Aminicenantes bacterium]|nr:amino acid adenylation domain-containing protein [Candidatus Aminicenantes bacterium]NIM79847.1 amino acid adenylation domain-containing protein [Candidatus Aminicenantes bacterium]NIN19180.1 amino acid adenylation domain-containing protein [Candidatus Aminicenantes bacterium]NIN43088.1 amino acid adenylation domain-containing protein [Candidatus Aminicenantes bacterium]NIN85825.1 amino acid adenylation domain-containing protein [Candidatus Aminicenantes bacterium]
VWEMYGALLYGGRLVVIPRMTARDSQEFLEVLTIQEVTVLNQTPAAFYNLSNLEMQRPGRTLKVRYVIFGGDVLNPFQLKPWKEKYPETRLVNMYGITETTVHVTYKELKENDIESGVSNIGRPIPTLSTYIFDRHLQLVPVGVAGEICVGGEGVCQGYLNRPELTGEKFVETPYIKGERFYRSGDLGRYLGNGDIEYLGRMDQQVQIRGYRVEPGEIETRLVESGMISEAVVIPLEDNRSLCAYIVPFSSDSTDTDTLAESDSGSTSLVSRLKEWLLLRLPEYMIPAYFVRLDRIPLTPNGKVDRKALPEPEASISTAGYVPPRNEQEEKLAAVWSEVLNIEREKIGIDDDFFELGGHSLKATILVARIHQEMEVNVPLTQVFIKPTIRGLTHYIEGSTAERYTSIDSVELKEYYPLSSAQKRLYVLQQMEPENTSYNMPDMIPMGEDVDRERLKKVFEKLIARHEILRTSFEVVNEEPVQRIHQELKFEIEYYEAGDTISDFRRPFDFSRAPLFRVGLIHTLALRGHPSQEGISGENYILLLDMHHVITDGSSQGILAKEFAVLYTNPEEELPSLRLQYKDFSEWQNSREQRELVSGQKAYWTKEFSDELPVLDLPTDVPRPLVQSSEGNVVRFTLNREETKILKDIIKEYDITLFMVLLVVFNVLFSKLSGQEDIVLGTPIAARRHTDLQQIVGMLVNTLALRNYPSPDKTFVEFLKEIKQRTLEAYENQEYHFEDLVDHLAINRDTSRNPVFDVMLNLLNQWEYTGEIPEIDEQSGQIPYVSGHKKGTSRFDMAWSAVDFEQFIHFTLEYSTKLFTSTTIEKFIHYLKNIILHLRLPENRQQKLCDIPLLAAEEREEILKLSNGVEEIAEDPQTLQQLFEGRVGKAPDNTALVFESQHMSYCELNQRANQLARLLREKGVRSDTVVGLMVERSIEMVIGILAIIKAGGAYLPIDPEYPQQRILSMLMDSGVSLLLTKSNLLGHFSITAFKNMKTCDDYLVITPPQRQIKDFDNIPIPDRTLIDYNKYHRYIGEAPAKNTITMQATRGCPYNCLYCHKIWPKTHVVRSAENVLKEILYAYDAGLRRFVFIDDIFNLDQKNASQLLEIIIKKNLDIQLFFPNGFRADILTKDFIDLMMEAGTVNLDVALESASPRIQRLIKKNLNLEKFKEYVQYITETYPHVILEMEMMHGFPTETEEEAVMTLDFLKELKWVHFPNLHVLKIFPNTDICRLAVENGISQELIEQSADLAFHELPDTLPFPKGFTRQFQARFMGEYFLLKERLLDVLPHQMNVLTEDELVQKYDSYLSFEVKSFDGILQYMGISREELGDVELKQEETYQVPEFREKISKYFPVTKPAKDAFRILLLDLSQLFTEEHEHMLHHQIEEPLGLLYLMSYLNEKFKDRIIGKVFKSKIDFDSYDELKNIIIEFKPHLIGIRTLSFYKEFFHKAVLMIRQWGMDVPVVAGGPYATSDYRLILQDPHVDVVVMGEGELTLGQLVEKMMENGNKLPDKEVLQQIRGIVFLENQYRALRREQTREVILLDEVAGELSDYAHENLEPINTQHDLLYVIYTSGSTGKPKGIMLEHRNLANLIRYQYKYTNIDFSRVLQFTTISFDVSAQEIFSTLLAGGELTLVSKETLSDVPELFKVIEKKMLKTLFVPASFLKFVINEEDYARLIPGDLHHIVTAGEQLIVNQSLKEYLQENKVYLHNHYGPAETHVVTTLTLDPNEDIPELPSIGKPIMNTAIYILDRGKSPVPVGVPGELVIGGIQVGRGYFGKKQLTAERFISSPFSSGERLYWTGDLARWLKDGNIEFLGRIDYQVKIRGFRIEPGEVENQLMALPGIKEAVVLDREDAVKGKYLCAYLVSTQDEEVDGLELREKLSRNLPDYMVPSYFVKMEKIPLTPNRKVDRRALPEPVITVDEHFAAPGTEEEEKLAELWWEILGIEKDKISIHDNFFELGGHSLKATILTSKVHKAFDIKLPLLEIFKTPTIKKLARYIKEAKQDVFISIEPVEKREYYLMSSSQRRLYVLQQMESHVTAYNMLQITTLQADLDKEKLEQVLQQLIQRHETLRTSFHMIGEEAVQRVHDEVEFEIEYFNLTAKTREDTRIKEENHHSSFIIHHFVRAFDLSKAPLLRVGMIKTDENQYILVKDLHHIITDGMSEGIFLNELMALYQGSALPALLIQYKDYAVWQQSETQKERIKQQEAYWVREFEGEIPVLSLPTDFTRPAVQSFEGREMSTVLEESIFSRVKQVADERDVTLFMVLLSLVTLFLSKLSGQEDIVVGTSAAGREHADLQPLMGMFVNTLALRNRPTGEKTFSGFLKEVRERTLLVFANQEYLFEDLVEEVDVERDTGRNPLFDVMLTLPNMDTPETSQIRSAVLNLKPYSGYESRIAKFDMSLVFIDMGNRMRFTIEYCTRLFEESTIERFLGYFDNLVLNVLDNPGQKIKDIEMIAVKDKEQILYEFNNTEADYPQYKTIHRLFAEQVEMRPDTVAVVGSWQGVALVHPADKGAIGKEDSTGDTVQLSYKELDDRSNQLAHMLRQKGVQPGSIVGIMTERCVEMIIDILGILKAGSAYLPIDPDYPRERIDFILQDSNAKVLESEVSEVSKVSEGTPCPLPPASPASPSNLAYIIFTSGTTGRPKGALVEHRSVINLVFGLHRNIYSQYPGNLKVALVAPYVFDASVKQIFAALLLGHCLTIVPEDIRGDGKRLSVFYREHGVDVSDGVPMTLRLLVENGGENVKDLRIRHFIIGGEALPQGLVEDFLNAFGGWAPKITNVYGPAECCVDSTWYEILPGAVENIGAPVIPIGKPMPNVRIYILNREEMLQPPGIAGEIFIGGDGVGRGYLNRPELTAEKFDHDLWDFQDYQDEKEKGVGENKQKLLRGVQGGGFLEKSPPGRRRLYKTGDLARWLVDGNIEFLGRIDQQVKIRGYRIELGEIEYHLLQHKEIKEAVVVIHTDKNNQRDLCAYVVTRAPLTDQGLGKLKLKEYLSRQMPTYMVPTWIVPLERIPLTPNGKIDRKALPGPRLMRGDQYAAPRTQTERELADIWADILDVKPEVVGIDDGFFELGGHSLKATIMIGRIHKAFQVRLTLAEVFQNITIRQLARCIKGKEMETYFSIEPAPRKDYYEVSSAQKRLYILQQINPDSIDYNMPLYTFIQGDIDRERLKDALHRLILRYEVLRTSIQMKDGQPVQVIYPDCTSDVEYINTDTDTMEEPLSLTVLVRDFVRPFDMAKPPLFRVRLKKVSDSTHFLIVDMHHIITDGVSLRIFIKEFMALYAGQELPPVKLQYKDFSQWQNNLIRSGDIKKQENYWLRQFEDDIPQMELPLDYPRPPAHLHNSECEVIYIKIPAELTSKVRTFTLETETTPYMVLLAVYNILLSRYSNQEDIVVGSAVAGRRHADLENIMGMFVNMLVMRNHLHEYLTFMEFLQQVKITALNAYENQDYQFDELVNKLGIEFQVGRNPLFDTQFSFQNAGDLAKENEAVNSGNSAASPVSSWHTKQAFDLGVNVAEKEDTYGMLIGYLTALFKRSTIENMAKHYVEILEQCMKNINIKIKDIAISLDLVTGKTELTEEDVSDFGF